MVLVLRNIQDHIGNSFLVLGEFKMKQNPSQEDELAKKAYSLARLGEYRKSFAIYADILKKNHNHAPSLVGYAEEMARRDSTIESLDVILTLLIQYSVIQDDSVAELKKRASLLFSRLATKPEVFPHIMRLFKPANAHIASGALSFLAHTLMVNGKMPECIQYTEAALEKNPDNINLTIGLMEAHEILNQPMDALQIAKKYLETHLADSVGGVPVSHILKSWSKQSTVPAEDYQAPPLEVKNTAAETETPQQTPPSPYSEAEMHVLNLYYKIVKLLFITGDLKTTKALVETIDPAKQRGGDLHLTLVRNSNSYFELIKMLLLQTSPPFIDPSMQENVPILYVMGDSHALSPAWREFSSNSLGRHWIKPLQITGCKIWHLRKESQFYTKVQFDEMVKDIPLGGNVIFIFGEIDCREGILQSIIKKRYSGIEEAMTRIIDIYLDVLKTVAKQKKLKRLFVHPVPPVLNETRFLVLLFNKMLEKKLAQLKKRDAATPIQWLAIEQNLLDEGEQKNLKEQYQLEGTHLNPSYLSLIAQAIDSPDSLGLKS